MDTSPRLAAAAATSSPGIPFLAADASTIPLGACSVDLVVSMMVLHDVDDLDAVMRECARVLEPGGRMCFGIVHPLASTGSGPEASHYLGPEDSYFLARRYSDTLTRAGVTMTFHSVHRPLEAYARSLESSGFLIETIREPVPDVDHIADHPEMQQWRRLPLFLHVRAVSQADLHLPGRPPD